MSAWLSKQSLPRDHRGRDRTQIESEPIQKSGRWQNTLLTFSPAIPVLNPGSEGILGDKSDIKSRKLLIYLALPMFLAVSGVGEMLV